MKLPAPVAGSGTYALLLRIEAAGEIMVGRRCQLRLEPGWVVYVGSAFGPGGTAARLAHHRRPVVRPHWHIDYLRKCAIPRAVWISHDPTRRECLWATVLREDLGGARPPFRFGASDCRCPTHLHRFPDRPALAAFAAALRARCPAHAAVLERAE